MKLMTPLILITAILASPYVLAAEGADAPKTEAPAARAYTAKTPKLNRSQVDAFLAKPSEILFIDVRRPDEISKIGSFPVYLNIQAKELESGLAFIPKNRSIITLSNHAGRAGVAADFLAEKGFKVVGAVGTQNYEEEGGKITKIAIPEPKPAAADDHAAHTAK